MGIGQWLRIRATHQSHGHESESHTTYGAGEDRRDSRSSVAADAAAAELHDGRKEKENS